MAIKKTQLYNYLWEAANALRGGMDASQYKDYVLTLLFVKYVSDRYKNDPDAAFIVPKGGSFDDLVEAKGNPEIGEKINIVLAELAKENDLTGVIDQVDFDDSSKLGTGKDKVDKLTKLIAIFENPELNFSKNRADGDDILGDVYEYFMKKFATEAGKSKGQFYTPAEVSRIMAQIIGVEKVTSATQTAYDPTCGSGSLLLKVAVEAKESTGIEISIYGQDIDIDVANLARMNMIMHGMPDAVIVQGNTLSNPKFLENGKLKTFDFAVANPPFSQKNWMNGVNPENDPYHRFEDGIPPAKNGDYAFLLHLIKSLKPTGKGAIILPHGILFRGGAEEEIRKNLIKRGYIKGIIGLPPNLFYGTGIPAIIMVIDKENTSTRKGIFMIDASRGFKKDGAKNRLREQDIHKIVTTFRNLKEIPGYSRMVSIEEIEKNGYNLNIPRYIENIEKEDVQDIYAHLHGGIPVRDIDSIEILKIFPELKSNLFSKKDPEYYQLKINIDELQDVVEESKEVDAFKQNAMQIFKRWVQANAQFMKSIDNSTRTRQFIGKLSESLLEAYKNEKVIDNYAMFQILMDYWDEEVKDDFYLIVEKGWVANPYRIIEKNNKGEEVDKGWTCDLIPKEIVIDEFFRNEKQEIEKLEEQRDEIERQMNELLEENSGEDEVLFEINNKTDALINLEEYQKLAWKEYFKDEDEYVQLSEREKKLENLMQNKSKLAESLGVYNEGKLTQKYLNEMIKTVSNDKMKKSLSDLIDILKEINRVKKEIKDLKNKLESKTQNLISKNNYNYKEYLREIIIINEYLNTLEKKSEIEKQIKTKEEELDKKLLRKYPEFNEKDVKDLVVNKKWIKRLEERIKDEIDNIILNFTMRIKELAERYDKPLPEIEQEVEEYEKKVKEHLKIMGFNL
jgi:type I restriction enzyme M protein